MTTSLGCHHRTSMQAKLELAEEVLEISNQIVQLTIEIFVRGDIDSKRLIEQQVERAGRIRELIQDIAKRIDSDKERELFTAASARWASLHRCGQSVHALMNTQKLAQAGAAITDVLLPLLLDNASWRAFIEFLRAANECSHQQQEQKAEISARSRELIRANQDLKSKIAERKRVEERLSQLASIIESSSDAIIIHTLDGTMVSWNAGAERIYGYWANEVLGKPTKLLLPPDQIDELPKTLEILKRGETVQLYETVHVRKDGRQIDVSTAISPVRDADGRIVGAATITRDITDRKKAEERFYKAFNANPAPITISTLAEGRYIDVNESFLRVTGCTREEVIGRTSVELKFWERAQDRAELISQLETQGSVRDVEITLLTKSGEQRIGMNSAEIIEIGGENCVISMFHDMTEQKMLEKQLRKSQRMEAIGQLSGGIAHDFNNLLTVMIGHSELLQERLDEGDLAFRNVEEIKKAGTHAASLTRQLLAFSRQQMLEQKVLDLNTVIGDLEKMLRRLIGENIEFNTVLDPKLGRIKADPGQIQQVIMNLVVNARDAMPEGGRLLIRTANAEVGQQYPRHSSVIAPGPYVMLEISDTGIGMDSETQVHIFEPFFTTKEVGKGTGLGLSTVYGVIKQSGGHIYVDSAPGHGATFTIYLPKTAEKALPHKPGPYRAESLRGDEIILLVEDASQVRELTRDWLVASGYTVLEAKSPAEAMQIAERHGCDIDLLIADVIMPGMNGPALAKSLTHNRPDMKVLYISGYTGFMDQNRMDPNAMMLSKPFTRDTLLRKVREVLSTEAISLPA